MSLYKIKITISVSTFKPTQDKYLLVIDKLVKFNSITNLYFKNTC